MKEPRQQKARGVVTVFFTLLSVIFLSFLFMLLESARYYGVRAQAAAAVDNADFSVFAQFEKELLSRYNLFALDGACGTGNFQTGRIRDLFWSYLEKNAYPKTDSLEELCFDPWQLKPEEARITSYALLSDDKGENFYQQAVAFMHDTPLSSTISEIHEHYAEAAEQADEYREHYENAEEERRMIEDAGDQADAAAEDGIEIADAQAAEGTDTGEITAEEIRERQSKNPLPDLARVFFQDILTSVCHGLPISEARFTVSEPTSAGFLRQGTLSLPRVCGGAIDNMLFEEYLLQNFPNFRTAPEEENADEAAGAAAGASPGAAGAAEGAQPALAYQLEYILSGKRSDRDNLKEAAKKLLALREAFNFASSQNNPEMTSACESLAAVVVGWTGNAALVESLTQALLAGWCYGESMLDVKNLMHGGLVPLMKEPGQWQLTLDRLGTVKEMLTDDNGYGSEGMRYKEYLLILLNMTKLSQQKMRGLDMIEMNVRTAPGMSQFHVDQCIVAMKTKTTWEVPPVFARVPGAFLFFSPESRELEVDGGFTYMPVEQDL